MSALDNQYSHINCENNCRWAKCTDWGYGPTETETPNGYATYLNDEIEKVKDGTAVRLGFSYIWCHCW